ncbi:MAG TPA: peptidylprolyl isomerase [Woeseiaceae bacterium]|nr:peptidylprolyl isomerase [Woeseiaceae bacterium]
MITIRTNHGDITVELFDEKAPVTCANFRQYAADGFFDGTIFHRVIPNFMIQGGGFDADMRQKKTGAPIRNEAKNGESNRRGTLAMARTSAVDSATAQFFINLKDNTFLDHGTRDYGYAVFGSVTDGMEVVDAIAGVATGTRGGHGDVPLETVEILEIRIDD